MPLAFATARSLSQLFARRAMPAEPDILVSRRCRHDGMMNTASNGHYQNFSISFKLDILLFIEERLHVTAMPRQPAPARRPECQ